MLRWWSTVTVLLICIHGYQAQQTYVNNRQLDCDNNYTTASGYACNGATSCQSYITFRSQSPYNTPSAIAALLNSTASTITSLNNISSNSATIPADTVVVVPIANCSCSGDWYQHNAFYRLQGTNETYFSVANNTYEGLTTCQAMIAQNPYNFRDLAVGTDLLVPIRCACPTANQTAAGIRYLLTYLITWGNTFDYMSRLFDNVTVRSIFDANELSEESIVFPFTPILIPLTTTPTRINVSATPAPPPAPPVIPVSPGSDDGGSSNKWVFVGVGIGVGLLLIVSLSGVSFWFFRKRKIQQRRNNLPPAKHSSATEIIRSGTDSWSISSEGVRIAVGSLTVYRFDELQKATGDFCEENRVKGSVYRGVFNGDLGAVKVMKGDVSGEINILKQINHSNIIRLSGFCLYQGNTYLVYEFADNGSISDWLHATTKTTKSAIDTSVLEWKQRVQIAHDIADALNYLHNYINPPYIHKNLKSSNVLLDANMRAKITNFGLARSVEEDDNGNLQLTRHVVGTFGYMPPEYIENGLITPKMDVFALGVLISELLSGKEAASKSPDGGGDEKDVAVTKEVQLSEMVKEVVSGGDNVREKLVGFMDERLRGEYPVELAYSMAEIAARCVAADLNDRPTVAEVLVAVDKILSSSLDWDPSDELEHSRSLSHGR